MVRPLWNIASLGELASGVPLRHWITFHMLGPSELDIASWRRLFQLSVLALLIASLASRQAPIHSWRFWWLVWRRRFRLQILACIYRVIQGVELLLGLDFPTGVVAAEIRMSLKRETWRDKLGSLGRLLIFDSTSFVKLYQSTSFLCHLADLGMTDFYQILWLSSIIIGRWSQLPMGSASLQDVFADQLLLQREMSGVLSLLVIRLVRVAELSLRMCRSLSRIQSRISSPRWSWGWSESYIWRSPLRSPGTSEERLGLIKDGSNELCWVEVFGR